MKDSGIDWIGTIPIDWIVEKGKFTFLQRNTKGNDNAILLAATQKFGMIPQTFVEGVVQVKVDTDLQSFKTVHQGDFVISLRSFQGGFEMSDYEGVCSPAYQVFYNTKPICNKYYKYLFKSYGFISKMNSLVVGIREGKNIQYKDFADSMIPIPPLPTQQRIADFLDRKCAEIDELAALQETMIEELKRYKQSLITETVTKGLDPDVPMKDSASRAQNGACTNSAEAQPVLERKFKHSGVEWIGEIPEHWEVKRIKHIADVVRGGSPRPAGDERYYNGNIPFMKVADITKDENIYVDSCEYTIKEAGLSNTRSIEPGTLLLTNSGATLGVPKINTFPTTFNDGIAAFLNLSESINILFAYYSLKARTKHFLEAASLGIGQPNLNTDIIGNTLFLIPPLAEQKQIADYLVEKCAEIDELIAVKQQKIEALKEYKKSVIFEYVTGKKEIEI